MEAAHLNIIQDNLGNYYVQVAKGAERIELTGPIWNLSEAQESRRKILANSDCVMGRTPQ